MTHLGTLEGMGELFDGATLYTVAYRIEVHVDGRRFKCGAGTVALDRAKAVPLIDRPGLVLRLRDGVEVAVIITNAGSDAAALRTSGAIPGF